MLRGVGQDMTSTLNVDGRRDGVTEDISPRPPPPPPPGWALCRRRRQSGSDWTMDMSCLATRQERLWLPQGQTSSDEPRGV